MTRNTKPSEAQGTTLTPTLFLPGRGGGLAAWFALRLLILYALLIAPWPGLKAGYGAVFRGAANSVLTGLDLHRSVELRAPAEPHAAWDVEMHFQEVRTQRRGHVEYSSRAWGYLPTAAVIALTLATPLTWPRRRRAVASGLVLVHVFIAARVAAAVVYALYVGHGVGLSDFTVRAAQVVLLSLSSSPVTTYAAAVVIWLIVAFRREDWHGADGTLDQPAPGKVGVKST